jgi:hypothetical protein
MNIKLKRRLLTIVASHFRVKSVKLSGPDSVDVMMDSHGNPVWMTFFAKNTRINGQEFADGQELLNFFQKEIA